LIRRVRSGDRRDHYEAETDIWEVAARIAAGRKEREIDPAVMPCAPASGRRRRSDDQPGASKRLKECWLSPSCRRWYGANADRAAATADRLISSARRSSVSCPPGKIQVTCEIAERMMALQSKILKLPAPPDF